MNTNTQSTFAATVDGEVRHAQETIVLVVIIKTGINKRQHQMQQDGYTPRDNKIVKDSDGDTVYRENRV